MRNRVEGLTGGRLLALNTVWNIAGTGLPLLFAIYAIPRLINGLGVERFGILSLAWVVIGYFSLFDLGVGRALTKLVADKLGEGKEHEIPELFWTGLLLMLALGLCGMLVMAGLSPFLSYDILKLPSGLEAETLYSFLVLAAAVPVVIVSTGLRGYLAAIQRFGVINAIRVPMGVFTYIGPLLVLPFSPSVFVVSCVLVAGRVVACLAFLVACVASSPSLGVGIKLRRGSIRPLVSFGGWITVSNIVSPLMSYIDRFFVGAMISLAAVAYYTTPYDVVTKLLVIPGALTGVLFPAFATSFRQDREKTMLLFASGLKFVYIALLPVIVFVIFFAREILQAWLGAEFAANSTFVLQWLAAGVFINCLAQIPFSLLQGIGRPDITAKLHLVEVPVYLLAIWLMIRHYGINGLAVVWTVRVAVDAAVLFVAAFIVLPVRRFNARNIAMPAGIAVAMLLSAALPVSVPVRLSVYALLLVSFSAAAWHLMLSVEERASIYGVFLRSRKVDARSVRQVL